MHIVKKYIRIKELDDGILNEFIDKIHIYEAVYEDNVRKQQIDIHYKFVGLII